MTHHEIIHILAGIFLVCVTVVYLIEVFEELGSEIALRLKWTLLWSACRWIGAITGTLLALDVLF